MDYKKRKKLAGLVALGGITLALIIIFSAQKAGSQNGAIIGVGVFVAACVATAIIDPGSSGKSQAGGRAPSKYDPLLLDERTKQHHDVQRLLQYTSVQKTFFDPSYLGTTEAQNDPSVRELLAVFDQMLANGEVYPSQIGASTPYAKELLPSKPARIKNPKQIVGMILGYIGTAVMILPFVPAFITVQNNPEGDAGVSSLLFAVLPVGILLIIIGSVIGRH